MTIFKKLATLEKQASEFGFKWDTEKQIIDQIRSEITEIEVELKTNDRNKLQEEVGDLLHAVFSFCIFYQFDPETTLMNSVNKFADRFEAVRQLATKEGLTTLNGKTFEELMSYWERAKHTKQYY